MADNAEINEVTKQVQEVVLDENGQPLSKNALKKLEKERQKKERAEKDAAARAEQAAAKAAATVDNSKDFYGKKPMNRSQDRPGLKHERFTDISASRAGEKIWIRARVQTSRPT
ncbi:hypothetical protein BX616_006647, partial [Lobosporangium transversale]